MLDHLTLPAEMRDEIVAHARESAPRECCGVIVGLSGQPGELRRMTNTYEGIDFYEVDGRELLSLMKELDEKGWDFTAIYHSHPVSPAYPSPRDVEYAGYPDTAYIICSLENPDAPVVRAFAIVDAQITELPIHPTA